MNKTSIARQAKTSSVLPPAPGMLQRKCACGNHTVAGGECAGCAKNRSGFQRKLAIGASNDPLEHEADRVADQVMAAQAHSAVNRAPPRIQRYPGQTAKNTDTAPASVDRVLAGSGRPLEPALRQDMEQRFGHDFSRVRVHSGGSAGQSAREVNAKAYTVGHNVVFGTYRFAPGTHEGRRLIAHELTHVLQQTNNGADTAAWLQREPDKPVAKPDAGATTTRKDVVLLMAGGLEAEAATLAPDATPIQVSSVQQMAAALKGVKQPIGRLFIIAHSLPSGDLGFEAANTTTFVQPTEIAAALSGTVSPANAPDVVDFRGCSIGSDPKAMNAIRAAVGAKSAIGGNCFMVVQSNGPVLLNGKKIVTPSQVTPANRTSFESGLGMLIDRFGEARNCVLNTSEKSYFRAGGHLVAAWMSPDFDTKWDVRKSKCYKSLVPETANLSSEEDFSSGLAGQCRLIKVVKPAAE